MATQETQQIDAIIDSSRRRMMTIGGTALAGIALAGLANKAEAAVTDTDILNFALNLEYLEANYYNLAVYGVTIDKLKSGQGNGPISIVGGQTAGTGGTVTTKPNFAAVPFSSSLIANYATETALEEGKHVILLQAALGTHAVAQPNLDLYNSFNTLAGATTPPIGAAFDPFASDANFLIGAYIFEDTGVSAYHGAAGLIQDKNTVLPAAVGIHAVEAYHAGLVRTSLAGLDAKNGNTTLSSYTVAISNLRLALSVAAAASTDTPSDPGLTTTTVALNGSAGQYTASTLVNAPINTTSIAQGRNANQILAIVTAANSGGKTATAANTGLFYPSGLNGNIN